MTLSLQLLWNYWSIYHETWNVDRTSYGVMHIGRKFWSPHFCGSYALWNWENIRKSTNNLSFLCQFFINEITASDAGPDIIRSHLFLFQCSCWAGGGGGKFQPEAGNGSNSEKLHHKTDPDSSEGRNSSRNSQHGVGNLARGGIETIN